MDERRARIKAATPRALLQSDLDAMDAAEFKRNRKAAKLVACGL
jgi:hypothetical protein